jgi:hypothetical protein
MRRSAAVIIATAGPRRPESRAWSFNKTGHVATTISNAQIMELRKGLNIQKLAAMSILMKSTARVVWVTSRETLIVGFICSFLHYEFARFSSFHRRFIVHIKMHLSVGPTHLTVHQAIM